MFFEYEDEILCIIMKVLDAFTHSQPGSLIILISNIKQNISLKLLCSLPRSNYSQMPRRHLGNHIDDLTLDPRRSQNILHTFIIMNDSTDKHTAWFDVTAEHAPEKSKRVACLVRYIRNSLETTRRSSLILPSWLTPGC